PAGPAGAPPGRSRRRSPRGTGVRRGAWAWGRPASSRRVGRVFETHQASRGPVVGLEDSTHPTRTGPPHTSGCSPARGGHLFRRPCRVVAASCVNELTDTYSPRKRSSTLANRNRPLPRYLRSSNSIVTSVPRQKPLAADGPARPTTGRLRTA